MPRDTIGPWLAKKAMIEAYGVKHVVVADVGAFKGDVTEFYRRMFDDREIHCFEPLPDKAEELAARFEDDPTIVVNHMAVDYKSGNRTLHVGGQRGEMSSLLIRPVTEVRRYYRHLLDETVKVPATSLDEYAEERGLSRIHLLKMDTHGNEIQILRGATNLITGGDLLLIYAEVFFVEMYARSPMFWEVWKFLRKYGYELFDIYNLGRSRVNRRLKYADVLFVSQSMRERVLDQMPEEWLPKSKEHALGAPS